MTTEVIPENEAERLAAVRRYEILDTPPDGAFDRITALAARLFEAPISIVSLVDSDRIWFKSHHGLEVEQIDREPGLCASAILQDSPWLVTDAAVDPRTLSNPLVAGEFGLRFYLGIPLATSDGYNLGTLCVIDQEPRSVADADVATLRDLAAIVMDEMELRLAARRTVALEAELRRSAESVARKLQESLLPPELPEIPGLELAARYHAAHEDQVGGDFYDVIALPGGGCAAVVGDACGKGTGAAALTGTARWTLRTVTMGPWTPGEAVGRLNEVVARAGGLEERYLTVAVAEVRVTGHGADVMVAVGGHPRPLVVRESGQVDLLGVRGPIVGWRAGLAYPEAGASLTSGDVVVLYTDGLLERAIGHGATDEHALAAVLRPLAGRSAVEVASTLDAALGSEGLRDDAAFLIIRVR